MKLFIFYCAFLYVYTKYNPSSNQLISIPSYAQVGTAPSPGNKEEIQPFTLFEYFELEADSKIEFEKGYCQDKRKCRPKSEIYKKAFKIGQKVKKEFGGVQRLYINRIILDMDAGGVTKFMMSVETNDKLKMSKNLKGAIAFRICVPSSKSLRAYMTFSCANQPCKPTLKETDKCKMDDIQEFKLFAEADGNTSDSMKKTLR